MLFSILKEIKGRITSLEMNGKLLKGKNETRVERSKKEKIEIMGIKIVSGRKTQYIQNF